MNLQSKIHLISNVITNTDDADIITNIIDIIHRHKLDYSSNQNGIFLNLTLLDETIIDEIYSVVIPNVNTTDVNDILSVIDNTKTQDTIVEYDLKPDKLKFTPIDLQLLSLSKHTLSI